MAERWFAIAAETGREDDARNELLDGGVEAYLPLVQQHRCRLERGVRKRYIVERPLFDGYLFGHFDVETVRWAVINRARHVIGLVRIGPAIVAVRDHEIAIVRALEGDRRLVDAKVEALFKKGDFVRIVNGLSASYSGPVTRVRIVKGMPRLTIDVGLISVEVEQADVVPA